MAQLLIDQAIVSLLAGVANGDIYGGIAPENQRAPFITFQRVSGFKVRDINGPSGLARSTFQIDVYSDQYSECKQLADQTRKILDGFSGTVTIALDSITIGGVSMKGERDFTEDDTNPKLYRASVDYLFKYAEDI